VLMRERSERDERIGRGINLGSVAFFCAFL